MTGAYAPVLDQMLDLNRDLDGPAIWPPVIATGTEIWGEPQGVEFYVDFETVSLDNHFNRVIGSSHTSVSFG